MWEGGRRRSELAVVGEGTLGRVPEACVSSDERRTCWEGWKASCVRPSATGSFSVIDVAARQFRDRVPRSKVTVFDFGCWGAE